MEDITYKGRQISLTHDHMFSCAVDLARSHKTKKYNSLKAAKLAVDRFMDKRREAKNLKPVDILILRNDKLLARTVVAYERKERSYRRGSDMVFRFKGISLDSENLSEGSRYVRAYLPKQKAAVATLLKGNSKLQKKIDDLYKQQNALERLQEKVEEKLNAIALRDDQIKTAMGLEE